MILETQWSALRRLERAYARRRMHYRGHDVSRAGILIRTHDGRRLEFALGRAHLVPAKGDRAFSHDVALRRCALFLLDSAAAWRRSGYLNYARDALAKAREIGR